MRRASVLGAVLLVAMAGCHHAVPDSELFNEGAVIPSGAPERVLDWKVVSSSIDAPHQTMATLFGNDAAIVSARSGAHTSYPEGSVLALVTWSQKEDAHWFGGRIPKGFQSMEVVRVTRGASSYERLEGASLEKVVVGDAAARTASILGERASVMP